MLVAVALTYGTARAASTIVVTSPNFRNGGALPASSAAVECGGQNLTPTLEWRNVPAQTLGIAIMAFDRDAATNAHYWRWFAYDIPHGIRRIAGSIGGAKLPTGTVRGTTYDGGRYFAGLCPGKGALHHLVFGVYAMRVVPVAISPTAAPAAIASIITRYAIASGRITGTLSAP